MDFFKRIVVVLLSISMISYLLYLYITGQNIMITELQNYNLIATIVLILLSLFFGIFYWVYPVYLKWYKLILLFMWLFHILVWKFYLVNNVELRVWDVVIFYWVIIVLFGSTWVLLTKKVKKEQEDKKIEVIEV